MTINNIKDCDVEIIAEKLASLSSQEFMQLGFGGLSYITSVGPNNENKIHILHGADGSHITMGQDIKELENFARENSLVLMTVQ